MTCPKHSDALESDAYRHLRRTVGGYTHQLACRCDVPYWLRPSTDAGIAREQRLQAAWSGRRVS
jgi:hypothetical protein